MDILIATREKDGKMYRDEDWNGLRIHSLFGSIEGIMRFLEETGLAKVFQNSEIKDLVDYVFGVETGLDTNARKNRSGKIMEQYIADLFSQSGIHYRQQVGSKEFPEVAKSWGKTQKRIDFVVQKQNITYLIEVDFYNDGGSKLNDKARGYIELASKIDNLNNYKFVWITDGKGWESAKNDLEKAFDKIPNMFNLTTINDFISMIK